MTVTTSGHCRNCDELSPNLCVDCLHCSVCQCCCTEADKEARFLYEHSHKNSFMNKLRDDMNKLISSTLHSRDEFGRRDEVCREDFPSYGSEVLEGDY